MRNGSKSEGIEVMKVIKGKYELFPLDVFLKKQKTIIKNRCKKKSTSVFFQIVYSIIKRPNNLNKYIRMADNFSTMNSTLGKRRLIAGSKIVN